MVLNTNINLIQAGRVSSEEFFANALSKIRKFLRSANLEGLVRLFKTTLNKFVKQSEKISC